MLHSEGMQVESARLDPPPAAETAPAPEQIYARVFGELKPRTPLPEIRVEFRRYASASAQIRWRDGLLLVRIADSLAGAPTGVHEALAEILLAKLFRRPVPAASSERYRKYLNRRDVRRSLDLIRQIRGRKHLGDAQGEHYDLVPIFEELNQRYFFGLMARPVIGWQPAGVAHDAGPLRFLAQHDCAQPPPGPRRGAAAGGRVRDVSRDVAPAASGRA